MKVYTKIIGILSGLIVLALLGGVIYGIIEDKKDTYSGAVPLLLIPIYILLNFIIVQRFGFRFTPEVGDRSKNHIFLWVSLILSVGILMISFFSFQKFDRYVALTESLETEKNWGADTTAYGYYGHLKTKYYDDAIYYSIVVRSKHQFESDKVFFKITFLDKDGFAIDRQNIVLFTRTVERDQVVGIEESLWFTMSRRKYLEIADWDLTVRHKDFAENGKD